MKKILIIILLLFSFSCVDALKNIKINDESLSPIFDNDIHVYNYFTDSDTVKILVESSKDEDTTGYGIFSIENGKNEFNINSSKYGDYKINVYKNYSSNKNDSAQILDLSVEGYELKFNSNIHAYFININKEDHLNINYELENYDAKVTISGNENFNNTDNLIKVNIKSNSQEEEYTIHALKTITVSSNLDEEIHDMSPIKKEIIAVITIIISLVLIYFGYYIIFIKNIISYI